MRLAVLGRRRTVAARGGTGRSLPVQFSSWPICTCSQGGQRGLIPAVWHLRQQQQQQRWWRRLKASRPPLERRGFLLDSGSNPGCQREALPEPTAAARLIPQPRPVNRLFIFLQPVPRNSFFPTGASLGQLKQSRWKTRAASGRLRF